MCTHKSFSRCTAVVYVHVHVHVRVCVRMCVCVCVCVCACKKPTFSPTCYRALQSALHSLKRALHSLKSALRSLKRALRSLKRALHDTEIALHCIQKIPMSSISILIIISSIFKFWIQNQQFHHRKCIHFSINFTCSFTHFISIYSCHPNLFLSSISHEVSPISSVSILVINIYFRHQYLSYHQYLPASMIIQKSPIASNRSEIDFKSTALTSRFLYILWSPKEKKGRKKWENRDSRQTRRGTGGERFVSHN